MRSKKLRELIKHQSEPEREDPLYEILPRFVAAEKMHVSTVDLDTGERDELRRLLVEWDTGNPDAVGMIRYLFALEDGEDA